MLQVTLADLFELWECHLRLGFRAGIFRSPELCDSFPLCVEAETGFTIEVCITEERSTITGK